MNDEIAIKVDNVKKSFKLPHQKMDSLKGLFVNVFNRGRTFERQQVLKGVSFEVKKGEFLGIVGRNGGGKSTLLKLLAEIYLPDSGSITINGTLTPFIELGVGFNPDLTGRENVYLNGALLGFDRKAMDGMYDDIVKFAELEKFMDQKLKNYSSGMQVRLAFSVAIQAKTDILLIDEVLAVGDSNFQKKCFDVFERFKEENRTVIFISHSMDQVVRFCDRAILINKGKIQATGSPEVIATEYDMLNNDSQKDKDTRLELKTPREAHIVNAVLRNYREGDTLVEIAPGDGRHLDILNSYGFQVMGVNEATDLKKIKDISGLLILDNKKCLTQELISAVAKRLNDTLNQVNRVYIHLPFDLYQAYEAERSGEASHLAPPLRLDTISRYLDESGFRMISSSMYGADYEAQYIEAVFDRFNDEKREKLWDSLKA